MINIWLSAILTLLILGFLIFTAIRPIIVKPIIYSLTYIGDYVPSSFATVKEDYAIYRRRSPIDDDDAVVMNDTDLIVVVIGGAFLFKNIKSYYGFANSLFDLTRKSKKKYDLLVVRYPIRFKNTLHEAMLSINRTLAEVKAIRYHACHMIGFSAGALLTGTFIKKENNASIAKQIDVPRLGIRVDSFVSVCGLLYHRFENSLLNWLFDRYVYSGTPQIKLYSCQNLNATSTLVISSKSDILYDQTLKFIQQEPCENKIYPEKISHSFVQMIHLPQSEDAIKNIMKFIEKNTTTI